MKIQIENYQKTLLNILAIGKVKLVLETLINDIDIQASIHNDLITLSASFNKSSHDSIVLGNSNETVFNRTTDALTEIIKELKESYFIDDSPINADNYTEIKSKIVISDAVFLSVPIASFETEEELRRIQKITKSIKEILEYTHQMRYVFYAGDNIDAFSKFHPEEASIKKDFLSIHDCPNFVLLYPYIIASSALVEIGYAMSLKKNIIILTPKRNVLPFLLRKADTVFPNIKIIEFTSLDNISDYVKAPDFLTFN
jgi:hypothetical protein